MTPTLFPGGADASPGSIFAHTLFQPELHRIDELFVAAGVRAETGLVYRLLCREATRQGEVTDEGVYLRVPEDQLMRELRVSDRSARKYLAELEEMELIARLADGRGKMIHLLEPRGALTRLGRKPEVAAVLRSMYPERFDAPLVRAYTTYESPNEYLEHWVDERIEQTRHGVLGAALADAQRLNDAAHERRKTRESKRPKKPRTPAPQRQDRAIDLCEYLRYRVKDGLSSVFQPITTQKDLALMKRLRDSQGVENVRKAIEYVTTPQNWATLRKRCKLTSQVPTTAVLWGFKETIFPLALEDGIAIRSGGAVSGADAAGGDLEEFNGAFS